MGASDPVDAAYAAVIAEAARVYAAAGAWLRGQLGAGPRLTQKEAARRWGYSERQIRRAAKVLRARIAGGGAGGGGLASAA